MRVAESIAFLDKLERSLPESMGERVRMLRLLKEHPKEPLRAIAARFGASNATIERWWGTYCDSGIKGLLDVKPRGGNRHRILSSDALAEMRQLISKGVLTGPADVRRWIRERHDVEYSATGVRELLHSLGITAPRTKWRQRPSTARGTTQFHQDNNDETERRFATSATDSSSLDDLDDLLNVLVRLPTRCDLAVCADELRKSLRLILRDVDRISIDINTSCDLLNPNDYRPDMMVSQSVVSGREETDLEVTAARSPGAMAAHLLERFRVQGVSLDIYHPPIWREYYYEGSAYLGTIFLWRERSEPELSERTLARLDALEPFIVFLLTDIVTRHHYAHPLERVFNEVVATLSDACGLGLQERKILILRLHGETYKQIADQMNITINTVSKHVSSIYRRTHTTSTIDLFAKYFAPRMIAARKPR